MKTRTYSDTTEKTLITFHTGRGGHYWNAGHVSYVDQDVAISAYTDDLFLSYENAYDVASKIGKRENLLELYEMATEIDGNGSQAAIDRLEKITGIEFGVLVYVDCNGSQVGLNYENDGTGTINIDNDYDTTVVCRLEDCSDEEIRMIYESTNYVSDDVREYCKSHLVDANMIFEDED